MTAAMSVAPVIVLGTLLAVASGMNTPADPTEVFPAADPPGDGWLPTSDAAALLGITLRRFQDLADKRQLPRRKAGIRSYYPRAVIEQEKHRRENPPPKRERVKLDRAEMGKDTGERTAAITRETLMHQALTTLDRAFQTIGRMG